MCKPSTRPKDAVKADVKSLVIHKDFQSLVSQVPGRLELRLDLVLGAGEPLRKAADAIGPVSDVVQLLLRNTAAAASHAFGVATAVGVLEPTRRSKVQPGEGARLSKHVTVKLAMYG